MDLLASEQHAAVFGITSHGIFLILDHERMIFLSFEKYRGPLTANMSVGMQLFSGLSPGATAAITPQMIEIPATGHIINTSSSKIWKPPGINNSPLLPGERKGLIRKMAMEAYQQKSTVGLSEMLPALAGFQPVSISRDDRLPEIRKNINEIRAQLASGDLFSFSQTIQGFLGLGSGLTPSGDDFVLGLFLSLNRWGSVFQPGNHLAIVNNQVVVAAYERTTTLSANLIQSAVMGLADERLIQVVDYLATGEGNPTELLPGLLSWGNSSGIDAFVGMLTAFSAI